MIPRAKSFANYAQGRLATLESKAAGYDLPIFLTAEGFVSEGVGAGVAMLSSDSLVLPPLSAGVLPSITRKSLVHLASQLTGLRIEERRFDRFECYLADDLFFFGTGWEIIAIKLYDGHEIHRENSTTVLSELSQMYYDSAVGRQGGLPEWLMPTYG
jgi:branched-chain amino acid aminotransferase